jgi:hypothetical protein
MSLGTSSCAPSLGARAGGTITTTPDKALAAADVQLTAATRGLPIVGAVATVQAGPYTHSFLGGVEFNVPLTRDIDRREYPQVVGGRARIDLGRETLGEQSGAAFRLSVGASYPLFIVPNAGGDAWHIFQVSLEARIQRSRTGEFSAGPVLEYIYVPHGE